MSQLLSCSDISPLAGIFSSVRMLRPKPPTKLLSVAAAANDEDVVDVDADTDGKWLLLLLNCSRLHVSKSKYLASLASLSTAATLQQSTAAKAAIKLLDCSTCCWPCEEDVDACWWCCCCCCC